MIRSLVFSPRGVRSNGKLVCTAGFASRAGIDPARVCGVAASVRARLADHLGYAPQVDVFDPMIPDKAAWPVIFSDATVFEMRAEVAASLIVRNADARRLVAAAFGEPTSPLCGALSPIEARVLERLVREIASALENLTGPAGGAPQQTTTPAAHRCYFEMRFGAPIDATVGVALEEPPRPQLGTLVPQILSDVQIECSAEIPVATRSARELATLRVGSIVRFDTKGGDLATLKVGGQTVASGECGSHGESAAFLIRTLSFIGVFP